MSCKRYQRMAALEAGGDLPAADRPRLERHLQGCAACRSLLEELQDSRRATASLASQSIAPETLARVRSRALQRIDSAPSWRSIWPRSLTTPQAAMAVAAGVLVAVLAVWIWQGVPRLQGGPQEQDTVAARTAPNVPTPQPSPAGTGAGETDAAVPATATMQDHPGISHAARALPTRATVERPPVHEGPTHEEESVAESRPSSDSVATPPQQVEPMIIKLVSDQEDVVIYWLVGEQPQDKESDNVV